MTTELWFEFLLGRGGLPDAPDLAEVAGFADPGATERRLLAGVFELALICFILAGSLAASLSVPETWLVISEALLTICNANKIGRAHV